MGGKRELIEPHEGDERYMRRDESGQFTESDDLNRSLSSDNDREAQRTSEPGQGDSGDRAQGDQSSTRGASRSASSGSSSGSRKSGSPRGAAGRRNKGGMGGMGSGGGR